MAWNSVSICGTAKSAPRQFTKLLKPVLASFRNRGVILAIYIDDIYCQKDSYVCQVALREKKNTIQSLGFIEHEGKSMLQPRQQ